MDRKLIPDLEQFTESTANTPRLTQARDLLEVDSFSSSKMAAYAAMRQKLQYETTVS